MLRRGEGKEEGHGARALRARDDGSNAIASDVPWHNAWEAKKRNGVAGHSRLSSRARGEGEGSGLPLSPLVAHRREEGNEREVAALWEGEGAE